MPSTILVFEFNEKPLEHTVGRANVDALLWRGRIYERDWSDDETPDDSEAAEPKCIVTEDDRRFKPAPEELARIGALYLAASH